MEFYSVKKWSPSGETIVLSVPASKSLLNRAILLSALSAGAVTLVCGSYAEDTRVLLGCLSSLGIRTDAAGETLTIQGCGGKIPNPTSEIHVGSAGTAARFLTVALAFCGGNYLVRSSTQMEKRPMEVLRLLEEKGVAFEFFGAPYHFPFRMHSAGLDGGSFSVDTDESTQYASGLLLAASAARSPVTITLTGSRTDGSYIGLTLNLLRDFGIPFERNGATLIVHPAKSALIRFEIEPDISGASYFYAISLLFGTKVLVRRVRQDCSQGDMRFLELLKEKGVRFTQTAEGLLADGSGIESYMGFDVNLRDFSDQSLTVAALAAFAETPSKLSGIGHIRLQECDRIRAICENLNALGVRAESDEDSVSVFPAPVRGGTVETFEDHRVAMAFTLIGLKAGNVVIKNPNCCKKTFDNFFELITELTQ